MQYTTSYQEIVDPGMYDTQDHLTEEAYDFFLALCVNHNMDYASKLDKLSFDEYNILDSFEGYTPEQAARSEFIRLFEDHVNLISIVTGIECDNVLMPEDDQEIFKMIFSKNNGLGADKYKEMIENEVFE